MLQTILTIALLGVLVNGTPVESATSFLHHLNDQKTERDRSRTCVSKVRPKSYNPGADDDQTFMFTRLGEKERIAWENRFENLRNQKHNYVSSNRRVMSQQVPGGEISTTGLHQFYSSIQETDHYVYMLYYPFGTLLDQLKSCFYIGISKCIQNRLLYHMNEHRKKNKGKWKKIHGQRVSPVGICQLYRGSVGDCEVLEKMFVSQGTLLGLKLTNIIYKKKTRVEPVPDHTEYFKQLMMIGLASGEKHTSTNVHYSEEVILRKRELARLQYAKPGVLEHIRATQYPKKREYFRKYQRNRYAQDPKFREYQREYQRNRYAQDSEAIRESCRNHRLRKRIINMKKKGQQVLAVRIPWQFFQKSESLKITKELEEQGARFSMSVGEMMKECSRRWNALTPEQKQPYEEMNEQDKLRYQKEMDDLHGEQKEEVVKKKRKQKTKKEGKEQVLGVINAYRFYQQSESVKIKEELEEKGASFSMSLGEMSKECSRRWKALTPEQKQPYEEMNQQDKLRYQKEMAQLHGVEVVIKKRRQKSKKEGKEQVPGVINAYRFYQKSESLKIKEELKEKGARFSMPLVEMSKECSRRWKALSPEQKRPYEEMREADKLRYQKEMDELKQSTETKNQGQ